MFEHLYGYGQTQQQHNNSNDNIHNTHSQTTNDHDKHLQGYGDASGSYDYDHTLTDVHTNALPAFAFLSQHSGLSSQLHLQEPHHFNGFQHDTMTTQHHQHSHQHHTHQHHSHHSNNNDSNNNNNNNHNNNNNNDNDSPFDVHVNHRSTIDDHSSTLNQFSAFESLDQHDMTDATFSIPHLYHPVDISSIVHSPHSIPDLPATLPPLNSSTGDTSQPQLHGTTSILEPDDPSPASKKQRLATARGFRERAPWTPEEDNLLRLAVQLYGDNTEKWAKIAACVPGRTNKNCRKRWFHSLDPSLRKGAWTDEEDRLLREGVKKFPNQWSKIADMLEGRTDDQCAKRWRESLDPSIDRSDWTMEEDLRLADKFQEYGSQWQKIAQFFDGRPGLHCRNRWRKLQRVSKIRKTKDRMSMVSTNSTTGSTTTTSSTTNKSSHDSPNNSTSTTSSNAATAAAGYGNSATTSPSPTTLSTSSGVTMTSSPSVLGSTSNIMMNGNDDDYRPKTGTKRNSSASYSFNTLTSFINMGPEDAVNTSRFHQQLNQTKHHSLLDTLSPSSTSSITMPNHTNVLSASSLLSPAAFIASSMPSSSSSSSVSMNGNNLLSAIANSPLSTLLQQQSLHTTPRPHSLSDSATTNGRTTSSSTSTSTPSSSSPNNHNPTIVNTTFHSMNDRRQQDYEVSEPLGHLNPYGCDVPGCFETFSQSNGLFYHMKNVHPDLQGIDKPYRCAVANCLKKYKNINGLQYHLRDAKGTSGHAAVISTSPSAAEKEANNGHQHHHLHGSNNDHKSHNTQFQHHQPTSSSPNANNATTTTTTMPTSNISNFNNNDNSNSDNNTNNNSGNNNNSNNNSSNRNGDSNDSRSNNNNSIHENDNNDSNMHASHEQHLLTPTSMSNVPTSTMSANEIIDSLVSKSQTAIAAAAAAANGNHMGDILLDTNNHHSEGGGELRHARLFACTTMGCKDSFRSIHDLRLHQGQEHSIPFQLTSITTSMNNPLVETCLLHPPPSPHSAAPTSSQQLRLKREDWVLESV